MNIDQLTAALDAASGIRVVADTQADIFPIGSEFAQQFSLLRLSADQLYAAIDAKVSEMTAASATGGQNG